MADVTQLRGTEYDARQRARELRRAVFEHGLVERLPDLVEAERDLQQAGSARSAAEKTGGSVVAVPPDANLLGPDTTGIKVTVDLRMTAIPTALVHLFEADTHPLVSFDIRNTRKETKRLRLITYVEGYSARAIDTLEAKFNEPLPCLQLPTFFPDRMAQVTELTRASVNVEVEDLDARSEVHRTVPVWLLARTTAPLQVKDPASGKWLDMTPYLGAFVTPNAPAVMEFLRVVAEHHPQKQLVGYQVDEDEVASQVRAVYEALAANGLKYVNSVIEFTPDTGVANQRVRLPRESLGSAAANCIDATILMASLLEAISLNPAIVIVPGHAFLAWEAWRNNSVWRYVETTMIPAHPFADALARGRETAQTWLEEDSGAALFNRMSLRDLRAKGITPLE